MNLGFEVRRFLAPGLVGIALLGAGLELWWNSTRRAEMNFLPGLGSAQWILYPTPADAISRPDVELPAVFQTSFDQQSVPFRVLLHIAAFHRYALSINGRVLQKPLQAGKNWKQPDLFEVSGQLQPGQNQVEVIVFNSNGPPALWLSLDAGGSKVSTGKSWQVSYAGATWRAAALARQPKWPPNSGSVYRLPEPWTSMQAHWPALLVFALISAAASWVCSARFQRAVFGGISAANSDSAQDARRTRSQDGCAPWLWEFLPVAFLVGCWIALFANNLGALPYMAGFDVDAHMQYIRYIQDHKSLPPPNMGWETFQPPLYYLLSAAWLGLLHLSVSNLNGVTALRLLGLGIGVAHFLIVWASLRLLFPAERSKARWGVALAACLPPLLYLSQYITNEAFAATLVSACLWLTLLALKQDFLSWKRCAVLGACLGAALLTKSTALLVVPLVFAALLWKSQISNTASRVLAIHRSLKSQIPLLAGRMALIVAVCALVCGWHYARLWLRFGNPMIGVWDPRLGISWWQDDGYRTGAFYLRFGECLTFPWYAGFKSFGDGIYSTLWGDGLAGGGGDFLSRPPWNYDLMAIGYWLALLPALAVLVGVFLAVSGFVRRSSAEWFLVLGFGFLVALAVVHMSLSVPYYCMVKAFYGLSALIPFCACGAWGLDALARRRAGLRFLCCSLFGLWAITSYASFWVLRSSAPSFIEQASARIQKNQILEVAEVLKRGLQSAPQNPDLRFALAYLMTMTDHNAEGLKQAAILAHEHPEDCRGHHVLALALAHEQRVDEAIEETRRVMEMAPGYNPGWDTLAALLIARGHSEATISLNREALGLAPFSAELRVALGSALLFNRQESEASDQLEYAWRLNPDSSDMLVNLAWRLATRADAAEENGRVAVKLAEQACAWTHYQKPIPVGTLAAAYAQAGRFEEAVKTAERARALAMAARQPDLTTKAQALIDVFRSGRPYREKSNR